MTIIKQKAVSSDRHARNLRRYLDGKEALLRGTQNILDPNRWFDEMAEIRWVSGHDKPSRAGAANTIMYHQVLAFLPDEADVNGGPMTPERCMEYAREYAAKYYADYMIAFALHEERSPHVEPKEAARAAILAALPDLTERETHYLDRSLREVYMQYGARGRAPRVGGLQRSLRRGSEFEALAVAAALGKLECDPCGEGDDRRYAVHMAINRTNLETGNRLNEGKSSQAKRVRAGRVREMDAEWNLSQVVAGKANSRVHSRQPLVSRVEREIEARGGASYKADLRLLAQAASEKARSMDEFTALLGEWGATAVEANGKVYVCDEDRVSPRAGGPRFFEVGKLDPSLGSEELNRVFRDNAAREAAERRERAAKAEVNAQRRKDEYVEGARRAFEGYRKAAFAAKGATYSKFPRLRLPKPSDGLDADPDVQRLVLKLNAQASMLRSRLAKDAPVAARGQVGAVPACAKRRSGPEPQRTRTRER